MVLKIGLTFNNFNNYVNNPNTKYNNGLMQNILFIYNYFKDNDEYLTYIITDEYILKTDLQNDIPRIDSFDINNLITLDIIVNIGFSITKNIVKLRKSNTKLIKLILGNDCVVNMNDVLHTCYKCGNNTRSFQIKNAKKNLYDEIWISPHFVYAIDYYKYIYQTEKVFSAPYIWDSMYMGEPYTDFNHNELNVGVFESNLCINKSSLIPMIICDKAKDIINKALIFNSKKFLQSEHFQEFAKISELATTNRMSFESRHTFRSMMDKYCNVVVSFNENWDLNYLTLECFYLGIPIVHNSKMLKNWGYYYEGYDVSTAVRHLKFIKESFNRQAYINRHKQILFKYSMQNPEYIKFFEERLLKNKNIKEISFKDRFMYIINYGIEYKKNTDYYIELAKKIKSDYKVINSRYNLNFRDDVNYIHFKKGSLLNIPSIYIDNRIKIPHDVIIKYYNVNITFKIAGPTSICKHANAYIYYLNNINYISLSCDQDNHFLFDSIDHPLNNYKRIFNMNTITDVEYTPKTKFTLDNKIINPGKNIAILQLFDENIKDFGLLSQDSVIKYCLQEDLTYLSFHNWDNSKVSGNWLKAKYLREHLSKYDYIMYIDADIVITNYNYDLKNLIKNNSTADILCCFDVAFWLINSGSFIIKNSENSMKILNDWDRLCKSIQGLFIYQNNGDQGELIETLFKYKSNVEIFKDTEFNTHPNNWNSDCFLIHLMGFKFNERVKIMKYFNHKYIKDELT